MLGDILSKITGAISGPGGLMDPLQRLIYGNAAVDAPIRRREQLQQGKKQFQQLLGQQGQQYQEGMGQGMLENRAPTGYLGGQIPAQEMAARIAQIPGYEKRGLDLLGQQLLSQGQAAGGTAQMQNLVAMGLKPGTPEFNQAMNRLIMPSTAGPKSGPLGKEAAMWVSPTGEPANPMMTIAQATEAGYRPQTTKQIENIQATQAFAPMLGQVVSYGFGEPVQTKEGKTTYPQSLFPEKGEDWAITKGFKSLWESGQAATGGNPQLSGYKSTQDAMVSNLARMSGQIGTLTDLDVERVQSLLPTPYVTEQTEAKQKFKDIANLLAARGLTKEQMRQAGLPDWAIGGAKKTPFLGPQQQQPAPMIANAPAPWVTPQQNPMATNVSATGTWGASMQPQGQQSSPWLDYQR